jgi:hypothetical protein
MGSCRGLVRVSGPCTSVCCESHMAYGTALKSFSFFCFFVFILLGLYFGFFSLSSSLSLIYLGFWCTSFYHHPDFLCYLSYIPMVLPILSHCLLCLAFMFLHCCYHLPLFSFLLPFGWLVILFCRAFFFFFSSRLVSSLSSLPLFLYFVLAFFLPVMLRYVIIAIVSVSLLALSLFSVFFFTYDQLHYHGSTTQTSTPLFTARYHVCYCFCVWNSYR